MQLIGVQFDIAWEDKPANFACVRRLLDAAPVEAGSLIVLPEMFATGFSMNVGGIAEDADGPTAEFLAETARRYASTVLGGQVTRSSDGRGLNQAVAFGPDGREIARQAKLHPFGFAGETAHYAPGDALTTFAWAGFTVATLVCYDLRFPEAFRSAVRMGADLLAVIANWPRAREPHWLALLTARAIENQAYVIGVNRRGADPNHAYSGRSIIIDPRGAVLADAGGEEGVIRVRPDVEALRQYRREFPALDDTRDDYNRLGG